MTPERWQRVEQLLHSALKLEEKHRADFLKQACDGDEALLSEVQSQLACESEASRLTARRERPVSLSRNTTSRVIGGVPLGVMATRNPFSRAQGISSNRSGRFMGSPPVKTKERVATLADLINQLFAFLHRQFEGMPPRLASARQCKQAKSQVRVVFQMAM